MRFYIIIFFLVIFPVISVFAQTPNIQEYYFEHQNYGEVTEIYESRPVEDGIIISASINKEPIILKLDTAGNTVWSTLNDAQPFNDKINYLYFEVYDEYIFGVSYSYNHNYDYPGGKKMLWKVNSKTGEVIYVKDFSPFDASYNSIAFVNYDSSTLLLQYSISNYSAYIGFMDKSNGELLSSRKIGSSSRQGQVKIAIDQNKNIYFLARGKYGKINAYNLNVDLWSNYLESSIYHQERSIQLLLDEYDDLFILGYDEERYSRNFIKKINTSTGDILWYNSSFYSGKEMISSGDHLLVTYLNVIATKYNKADGSLIWKNTTYNSRWFTDFATTCSGDIYTAGQAESDWRVLKLSDADGEILEDIKVNPDSLKGEGLHTYIIQNKLITLGNFIDSLDNIHPYFASIDPVTGKIDKLQKISGGDQLQAACIDIEINKQDNRVYILKQIGNNLKVEAVDIYNGTIYWEFTLSNKSPLKGLDLKVKNEFVGVVAYLTDYKDPNRVKELYLYSFDEKFNHQNVGVVSFPVNTTIDAPYELDLVAHEEYVSDKCEFSIFYTDNDSSYIRNWFLDHLSEPTLIDTNVSYNVKNIDKVFFYGNNRSYIAGINGIYNNNIDSSTYEEVISFDKPRHYYYVLNDNGYWTSPEAYMVGQMFGERILTVYNRWNNEIVFTKSYGPGYYSKIHKGSFDYLFLLGSDGDNIILECVSNETGEIIWNYEIEGSTFGNTVPTDIIYNNYGNYIVITGYRKNLNGGTDSFIQFLNIQGDLLYTDLRIDKRNSYSTANTAINIHNDVWIGGAFNSDNHYQGYLFKIKYFVEMLFLTAVNQELTELSVIAYPNPANDIINLEGVDGEFEYSIVDITGKIYHERVKKIEKKIYIKALKKGTYLLIIRQQSKYKAIKFFKN